MNRRLLSIALATMLGLCTALAWAAPPTHGADHGGPTKGVIVVPSNEVHKDDKESAEEEEEGAPPGEINFADFGNKKQPPLLALLINFGILVYVYYAYGKGPVAQGLKERRDAIAKDIENAAMILEEAEKRAETYQAKLESKDEDAEAARTGLVQAGQGEKDRIIKEADEKAARLKKDAAFLGEQEVKQMQIDLVKQTVEKAIADAEAMLAKGVTQADQERLAEEYLKTLVTQKAAGAS